eukprot:5018416-Prymnesium_polylepis.1
MARRPLSDATKCATDVVEHTHTPRPRSASSHIHVESADSFSFVATTSSSRRVNPVSSPGDRPA